MTESEFCSRLTMRRAMCEKCEELDRKIRHYRRFTTYALDSLTMDRIRRLVEDLQQMRASMHPTNARSVE